MEPDDVWLVIDQLTQHGLWAGIAGGWGIDALLGTQTRQHTDLDVSIRFEDGGPTLDCLATIGYTIDVDWRPVRVAVRDIHGHTVDVHPLRFAMDGSAVQAGLEGASYHYPPDAWTSGSIGGRSVTCVTADLQQRFHTGYPHQAKNRHDLAALTAAGLIAGAVGRS